MILKMCIEEMYEICWRHFQDTWLRHWLEPSALEGRFSSFLQMTFHISGCLWLRISVHVVWKNSPNFFNNCRQFMRCWWSVFWVNVWMNAFIKPTNWFEWHVTCGTILLEQSVFLLTKQDSLRWTTQPLMAGLTIFIKDVFNVVIRVNLYFLHNEMKIS